MLSLPCLCLSQCPTHGVCMWMCCVSNSTCSPCSALKERSTPHSISRHGWTLRSSFHFTSLQIFLQAASILCNTVSVSTPSTLVESASSSHSGFMASSIVLLAFSLTKRDESVPNCTLIGKSLLPPILNNA